MGNCIVLQEKLAKIMKTDKKVLEYKAPKKVHEELPLIEQPTKPVKKKVSFADEVEEGRKNVSEVVRIKIVITKQELEALLTDGGLTVDDIVQYPCQKEQSSNEIIKSSFIDDDNDFRGWKPALDSIPELD